MKADRKRLREIFADPALEWILDRLRHRLERETGLAGTVTLRHPTAAERTAFDRLARALPVAGRDADPPARRS